MGGDYNPRYPRNLTESSEMHKSARRDVKLVERVWCAHNRRMHGCERIENCRSHSTVTGDFIFLRSTTRTLAVYRLIASKFREVPTADWPPHERLKRTEGLVEGGDEKPIDRKPQSPGDVGAGLRGRRWLG